VLSITKVRFHKLICLQTMLIYLSMEKLKFIVTLLIISLLLS